jgi:hypothetical protein
MLDVKEQRQYLSELGIRLKALRLARNDTMDPFEPYQKCRVGEFN